MAEKKIYAPTLFVVNATFFYKGDQLFTAGQVIAAGHPVLKGRQHLFRPLAPIGAPRAPDPLPEPEPIDPEPESEP